MLALRIFLFAGLVAHKVLWEVMKASIGQSTKSSRPQSQTIHALKAAKVVALAFLTVQTLFLSILPVTKKSGGIRIAGVALYIVGLLVAIFGRLQLGSNWANIEDRQLLPGQALITHGIYRHVRHPIYLGDLLLFTGVQLALNSWLFVSGIILALVTFRQAAAEEEILAEAFPEYETYRQRTKRLVPFVV
jgi:protein-S-isoprenylcysteine O-methyltransferase Ste14